MNRVFIVAGETSGDIHASFLVREMKNIVPGLEFTGMGGDMMSAEGVKLLAHIKDFSMMGFIEVVKHIPDINRLLKATLRRINQDKIPLVILVDYPGFNLNLAEKLRKSNPRSPKIFYYISPQVWAWRERRIPKIAKMVDRMVVILPFEEDIYSATELDVRFVGHPLIDEMVDFSDRGDFFARHNLDEAKPLIALLPGSRRQEVRRIFPAMKSAADLINGKYPARFAVGVAANIDSSLYGNIGKISLIRDDTRNLMRHADLVITKSGTSTLETAIAGTPMVVVYKMNPLTYQIGRRLVTIRNIALANVVAGKRIAPEFLQGDATPENICREALNILLDPSVKSTQIRELKQVKEKLGKPGASKRTAEMACELLNGVNGI